MKTHPAMRLTPFLTISAPALILAFVFENGRTYIIPNVVILQGAKSGDSELHVHVVLNLELSELH